MMHLPLEVRT